MISMSTNPFLNPDSPLAGILGGLAPVIAGTAAVVANVTSPTQVNFDRLAVALLPHQVEGVEYILSHRRAYIGDEMGVGKTYTAGAAIALSGAFPALVVCPPSLVLNWRKELAKLAPWLRVVVLSGMTPALPAQADVYVIGDAVLAAWVGVKSEERTSKAGRTYTLKTAEGVLARMNLKAIVVDEAHRMKSYKAKRTEACECIAKTIPASGLRVCMSGTAIVNRPEELVPQVRIIGTDDVFGGWFAMQERYAPKVDRFRRGAAHLDELHAKMTASFYLRRTRDEVLTLPGKGRISVATTMAGRYAREYMHAQDDLIAYVRGTKGNKAAAIASKAEALVLLTTLRNLIGLAKLDSVIEYVGDLAGYDSKAKAYDGEQVFVACWHTEVAQALKAAFPGTVTIIGTDSTQAKQDAVEAFQAGTARILVGNIKAAGVGITLTAARHVVIAELPWTPGDLAQVEDRLDRIGQTREVISHLMLGSNGVSTVDERLMGILNEKSAVTGMVLDGQEATLLDDETITQALFNSYAD